MAKNVTKKKILVADSEEDFAKALHARLKSNGYEVVIAADGVEAFVKAKKEKPDLVIYAVRISKRCSSSSQASPSRPRRPFAQGPLPIS